MREQTKEGTMEPKDMGNKIKNARMAKGMTQKELASQVPNGNADSAFLI